MKILAITQARIGSTRFHAKILQTINDLSLLEIHLSRILMSERITQVKVATTLELQAKEILEISSKLGVAVYQGSVHNVLDRFYRAAKEEDPDWVIRLTSDCPLIDPGLIDQVIDYALENDLDYACNRMQSSFPDGMDVEVIRFSALEKTFLEASMPSEQEHVTPYIWKNSSFKGGDKFSSGCVIHEQDYSDIRLTVDTIDDFKVIESLISLLGYKASWFEYVEILKQHPEIRKLNEHYLRDEGYMKSINEEKPLKDG
jgi:spore coat polysaccharide biosynthesis protein SpsF